MQRGLFYQLEIPIFRYSKTTNPELCSMREQRMLSCQLAEHPNFIEKLLQLADENELLEYCFQLLASLPIKRRVSYLFILFVHLFLARS